MVDYESAFKRPFSDLKKLLLAILFNLLPIVNFIAYGYFLEVAKSSGGKKLAALPDWRDYGNLFVNGFKALVIAVVYALPLIVVMSSLMFSGMFSGLGSNWLSGGMMSPSYMMAGFGYWMVLIMIFALASAYVIPMAVLNFAMSNDFSRGFKFGEVLNKAFTSEYFVVWLVSILYSAVVGAVFGVVLRWVPFVGRAISGAITGITMFTLLGSAYLALGPVGKKK